MNLACCSVRLGWAKKMFFCVFLMLLLIFYLDYFIYFTWRRKKTFLNGCFYLSYVCVCAISTNNKVAAFTRVFKSVTGKEICIKCKI